MEKQTLAACLQDRESYEYIRPLLEDHDLSDVGNIIIELVDEYYSADEDAESVSIDLLKNRLDRRFPKQREYLTHVLDNLENVSCSNVRQDFVELKRSSMEQEIAKACMSGDKSEIRQWISKYEEFDESFSEVESSDTEVYIGESVHNLLTRLSPENLVQILPKALNDRLGGGVPSPCHILVFAIPETGKTAFAINMACGFMNKGRKVLYICNEEAPSSMLMRFLSRLSGATASEIRGSPEEHEEVARNRGYDNLVYAALAPGTLQDIRCLIEEYQPDCVVVDQILNLDSDNDNKVEKLDELAKGMRNLSNEFGIVAVSITQAADSARDKLVLDMGDVYFSNTGIPAAVDIMIGIGVDDACEWEGSRFLSLVKNKISGDHSPVKVMIVPQLSKLVSYEGG